MKGQQQEGIATSNNEEYVWYFSYGSNMNYEVFVNRRGICTRESRRCIVPGYTLSYEYDGIAFYEPCFATCVKQEDYYQNSHGIKDDSNDRFDVHGMAFLISQNDFEKMLATEGGNGWNDGSCGGYRLSTVEAVDYDGKKLSVRTLTNLPDDNRRSLSWRNSPSQRYKDLVVNGAKDSGIDPKYVEWLESQSVYDATSKNSYSRIILFPIFLSYMCYYVWGQALLVERFKMKRYPWILARCFHLYNKFLLIDLIVPMIEFCTSENGYYNDDGEKLATKKEN